MAICGDVRPRAAARSARIRRRDVGSAEARDRPRATRDPGPRRPRSRGATSCRAPRSAAWRSSWRPAARRQFRAERDAAAHERCHATGTSARRLSRAASPAGLAIHPTPAPTPTPSPRTELRHKIAGPDGRRVPRQHALADAAWVRTALATPGLGGVILFDRDQLTGAPPEHRLARPGQAPDRRPAPPPPDADRHRQRRPGGRRRHRGSARPMATRRSPRRRRSAGHEARGDAPGRRGSRRRSPTAGFNLNFAPVVDLDVNPTSPAIGALDRSFSADPDVVVAMATIEIEAHRAGGRPDDAEALPGDRQLDDEHRLRRGRRDEDLDPDGARAVPPADRRRRRGPRHGRSRRQRPAGPGPSRVAVEADRDRPAARRARLGRDRRHRRPPGGRDHEGLRARTRRCFSRSRPATTCCCSRTSRSTTRRSCRAGRRGGRGRRRVRADPGGPDRRGVRPRPGDVRRERLTLRRAPRRRPGTRRRAPTDTRRLPPRRGCSPRACRECSTRGPRRCSR